ncbi:MAG: DUF1302 family protein [Rhodanobacter sp.]|nr:MAG: DUF1302 family protein [Rhodanobacter sp.]
MRWIRAGFDACSTFMATTDVAGNGVCQANMQLSNSKEIG